MILQKKTFNSSLVLHNQPYLHRAVSVLEKGLAAPIIILQQEEKNALTCFSLYESQFSWAALSPKLRSSTIARLRKGRRMPTDIVAQCHADTHHLHLLRLNKARQ